VNHASSAREPTHSRLRRAISSSLINPAEVSLVTGSALLTILSFPDFDLWFLGWVSLVPLLIVVARAANFRKALVAGWLWGTIFFYGTCWWLAYPMIHTAQFRAWIAYPLLLLPIILVSVFPAAACAAFQQTIRRFGTCAIALAPVIWISFECLRYLVSGQLWNALGYSQAFYPLIILPARWGGVYLISAMLVSVNAALCLLILRRNPVSITVAVVCLFAPLVLMIAAFRQLMTEPVSSNASTTFVAGVQPNVPVDAADNTSMDDLLSRHLRLSEQALSNASTESYWTRLVIWPESPMNFSYSRNPHLRKVVGEFASANHTSVLLNSLEPAKDGGDQNSAILVNEKGEMSARYDKIRLMPFGEYVPLPHWLPGASSVRGIVGEFTPGSSYTLMPLGALRAGVFICIEAAHPAIARGFTNEGADVLINISNDGYLGPTPVMRQHLANAVFRAVENDRDLIRVTNSGITAYISSTGAVFDQTTGFHQDLRTWTISKGEGKSTFYSRYGDIFVYGCALISLGFISASFMKRRVSEGRP
jgi:apolipoprotein N-acyltransferase